MGNTNINLDEELKSQAKQAGINISDLTERAIKAKLNVREVQIGLEETCRICGKVGRKETIEDVKKASLRDKAIAFGVFFDKARLERGEATVITAQMSDSQLRERISHLSHIVAGDVIEAEFESTD